MSTSPRRPAGTANTGELHADRFNQECRCVTFDRAIMRRELLPEPSGMDLYRMLTEQRPHLFADSPVFVPEACIRRQARIIAAVERVTALPAYQEHVLTHAPATARFRPKARGVFFGYDFHLGSEGSRLIEINTNAGGALLNALLIRSQIACGDAPTGLAPAGPAQLLPSLGGRTPEQIFLAMFLEEWRLERGDEPLTSIAIVDENPEEQFLYPEFCLFRNLFQSHGIHAEICDPGELRLAGGALKRGERTIDLVYNRLTDFGLTDPQHQPLRHAYESGAAVVTPHPHGHALYADKRNLAILTDEALLRDMGVDGETRDLLLEGIARTSEVKLEAAETLWAQRKTLFFKPARGYGSKAAYRGDKITRRVFDEVLQGDYVAQALVPPSERRLEVQGSEPAEFKLDLRNYVYAGQVQMLTTRLYQGQTTNFRTPGGGFAAVIVVPGIESSTGSKAGAEA